MTVNFEDLSFSELLRKFTNFKLEDRIYHPIYKMGTITEMKRTSLIAPIKITFDSGEIFNFFLNEKFCYKLKEDSNAVDFSKSPFEKFVKCKILKFPKGNKND